jgi:hypothetical protein
VKARFGPGLTISIGGDDAIARDEPALAACDQTNPRAVYVYGHYDPRGSLFYVGKGTGRRAWTMDRHYLWQRYVSKNLAGKFEVRIFADGMTDRAAEELEWQLMAQHGDALVNWANLGRGCDLESSRRVNALRDANRILIEQTRALEKTDPESAVRNYTTAIDKTAEYAFTNCEPGLVGQLLREECAEFGSHGEPIAIERLTMCLLKLGRVAEAAIASDEYFLRYRRDLETAIGKRTKARIEKVRNAADKQIGGKS